MMNINDFYQSIRRDDEPLDFYTLKPLIDKKYFQIDFRDVESSVRLSYSTHYYLKQFQKRGHRRFFLSWNWSAYFFQEISMLHRRMYLTLVFYIVSAVVVGLFVRELNIENLVPPVLSIFPNIIMQHTPDPDIFMRIFPLLGIIPNSPVLSSFPDVMTQMSSGVAVRISLGVIIRIFLGMFYNSFYFMSVKYRWARGKRSSPLMVFSNSVTNAAAILFSGACIFILFWLLTVILFK